MNLFAFKPYENEANDPLGDLREVCREVFPRDPRAVLRRVALVGALYSKEDGLWGGADALYFERATRQLASLNVPIAPDFELTPINFYYDPKQDFIAPDFRCEMDLLIVGAVFKPLIPSYKSPFEGSLSKVSSYHEDRNAWRKAAKRCRPSVIMTVGDDSEITGQEFVCDAYPMIRHETVSKPWLIYSCDLLASRPFAARTGLKTIPLPVPAR